MALPYFFISSLAKCQRKVSTDQGTVFSRKIPDQVTDEPVMLVHKTEKQCVRSKSRSLTGSAEHAALTGLRAMISPKLEKYEVQAPYKRA